jgi:hypothetical protein
MLEFPYMEEIQEIFSKDPWRMSVLAAVRSLDMHDAWVVAGFVRNSIWDVKYSTKPTLVNDIDVVYSKSLSEYSLTEHELKESYTTHKSNPLSEEEFSFQKKLEKLVPGTLFEVKNIARMHLRHGVKPFHSTEEAIANLSETATSVGIRLTADNSIMILAPHGVEDLLAGIVRPTKKEYEQFALSRSTGKHWFSLWPQLRFEPAKE